MVKFEQVCLRLALCDAAMRKYLAFVAFWPKQVAELTNSMQTHQSAIQTCDKHLLLVLVLVLSPLLVFCLSKNAADLQRHL